MIIKLQIQFQRNRPVGEQIVEQLAHLIDIGKLQPGEQLPTVRDLARELQINFNTVARAYRQLDDAGKITTQQGRGTFVCEQRAVSFAEAVFSKPEASFSSLDFLKEFTKFIQQQSSRTGQPIPTLTRVLFNHLRQPARVWKKEIHQRKISRKISNSKVTTSQKKFLSRTRAKRITRIAHPKSFWQKKKQR